MKPWPMLSAFPWKASAWGYWRLLASCTLLIAAQAGAVTDTITATGVNWTAPPGVTSVTVEAWGGGGGGGSARANNTGGGGGGGGGYSKKINVAVSPGTLYTVTVGTAGAAGGAGAATAGGSSNFNAGAVIALGGSPGTNGTAGTPAGAAGAAAGAGTGDVGSTFGGGAGADGASTRGGGGGGGGGSGGAGGNAATSVAGTGTATGGGNGGTGKTVTQGAGTAGTIKGGGGGGAYRTAANQAGGAGARGEVQITYTPATVIADGVNPGNVTLAPSGAITDLDSFTLVTSSGADSVTALTVTLTGANSFQALSQVSITNNAGTTTYFSAVANPASNTVSFSGGTPIPVTAAAATFKIRITPKTHVNMPVPPGLSYAIGGTVSAYTSTNPQSGSDGASATVTVDNLSPNGVTATSGSAGQGAVTLNWTTSSSADFNTAAGSVVYRWPTSAGAEVPAEGVAPGVGTTQVTAFVACVVSSAAPSTVVSVINGTGASASCNNTALTNGTAYAYKVFQKDTNGNWDVGTSIGTFTPFATTTLATGADPAAATIAPGAAVTDANLFTLQTNNGSETITSVTVNLSDNSGIGRLSITNNTPTELGFTTSPVAGSNVIALGTNITATTAASTYRVRVTPLSHALMPAVPGGSYAITAPVTAWVGTGNNAHAGSDTDVNALTIDNLSPASATATGGTPGNANATLNWTTSASADFNTVAGSVVYRWPTTAGAEVPAEGVAPGVGTTLGTAFVACVVSSAAPATVVSVINGTGASASCNNTALTNGSAYAYKVFQKDTRGNWDAGTSIGTFTPNTTTTLATGADPAATTIAPGTAATDVDLFTFQTNAGTETITSVTVNLSTNSGIGLLAITNAGNTVLGSTASPVAGSNVIALGTNITATTVAASYKVRVTPLSHALMPAVPGGSYAITAPVTAWAGSIIHAGSDTNANALTIDNLSPTAATATSGTAGNGAVTLNWTTSSAADFNTTGGSVLLRWPTTAGAEVPVEGTTYVANNTIGTATVACVISSAASTALARIDGASGSAGCNTTLLTNGVTYAYKIFQQDTRGNYDAGVSIGVFTPVLLSAPTVTKSFNPTSIASGGTSTLTITITNPNASTLSALAFTDTYPSTNLKNAAVPALSNTCGGAATGTAAASVLSLSGGSLTAGNSCSVTVNVTSAVAAGYTNSTGPVTATGATSGTPASALLTVFGAANKLAFYQQPGNTALASSITPAVTVQIQDASGNVVTTDNTTMVTIAKSAGLPSCSGTLSGGTAVQAVNGVATFSSLAFSAAGTACTLTATSAPVLTSAVSVAFDITALPASKLAFSVQPSKAAPTVIISPAITVLIQDSANNTITSSTATVTLAIGANPGGGTLAGTTSVAAVAGVATFSNLSINSIGTGYTLAATSSGLTGATSALFNITTATKLAFFQQPSNTSAASSITPAVTVQIQDASSALVSTSTDTVTVAIGTNPASGTLSGTMSVAAVAGVATFSTLAINNAGNGYTLTANAPTLTGATSVSFNISPLVCFTDSFPDLANWSVGNEGGTFGNPVATSNRLRMTNATGLASTYATLQRLFPAFGNKVIVEFLHYAYGGTSPGADGIGVTLSDASQAPAAGAFGGSLGYAPKRTDTGTPPGDTTHPGFVGGWLGLAIDEWGNFSANTEGRTGGSAPGFTVQAVAVRGSGSGYTGYAYLAGTGSSPGGKGIDLDYTTQTHLAASGPAYKYRVIVDHSDAVHAYASVERDYMQGPGGTASGYNYLIAPFDAKAQPGQAAVPTQWYLSFTGATGGSTNIHEISTLSVCSNSQSVIALDHIEIDHDGSGFPNIAESITIKACADAACSTLYLNSVTVNLSATNASGTGTNTWSVNPVTFTGGQTTVTLTHQVGTTSTTTLGTSSVTPTATNITKCYIGAVANCNMVFSTVSFDAVQPAAAAGTPIFTKLSGVNFSVDVLAITSGAINTGFTGAVTVDLVDPTAASGNCTDTNAGLTTATIYTFTSPGDNGRHSFTFNYPYAALNAKVRMRFGGNNYCSSDNFVIRPQVLTLSTTSLLNPASNSLAAGADFNLTANAGVAAGYVGSIPVKDPSLATIRDHNNVAIAVGSLTGPAFAAGTGTTASGTFQYQDVGTINFLANAVTDSAFFNQDQHTGIYGGIDHGVNGDCVYNSTSNTLDGNGRYGCNIGSTALGPLGKFVPDHFTLTVGTVTAACNGFTYMGQPLGLLAYTLEARNLGDVRTQKYTTVAPPYSPVPTPSVVAEDGANQGTDLASRISGLPTPGWVAGQYILSTAAAVFSRPTTPVATPLTPSGGGPFDLLNVGVKMVDGTAVVASRDMNAATSTDCATAANCDARQLLTGNPTKLRYGILKMDSASGSQQLNMQVPIRAMYMSVAPSQFVVNALDICTTIPPASIAISGWAPAGFSANFNNANRPAGLTPLVAGTGNITFTKPTSNASGKADIALNLGATGVTADVSCNTNHPATTAANLPWLQGKWGGSVSCPSTLYDRDPNASVTFGTNRSVLIYLRERY